MSVTYEKLVEVDEALGQFRKSYDDKFVTLRDDFKALEAKLGRPGSAIEDSNIGDPEHKAAFDTFMRKGMDHGLAAIEAKALNITTSADGGYAVPEDLDNALLAQLRNRASLRSLATVVQTASPTKYRKLMSIHGAAATWVGETSSRPETTSPKLAEIAPPGGELYASPAATQWMLDDSTFDAGQWLVGELAEQFGLAEGTAFVSGNGTDKPQGFLTATINTSSDATRTFGDLMMLKTGVSGDFIATTSSSNPADSFIATVMSLAAPYRANAAWTMNSTTLERVRKFKDAEGNYIWRPGIERGQPSLLLGYPVHEIPDMPDVASNTYPIAFGDWQRGYLITDHVAGTRLLRDPYTNKPYVHFYTTKRVGGKIMDSNAIRVLATRT